MLYSCSRVVVMREARPTVPPLPRSAAPHLRSACEHRHLLGTRVDNTSYAHATRQILAWARSALSRYVCVANVHVIMESHDDPQFRRLVNEADLVTPDGMPLVWALKSMGLKQAGRVYGPDLTLHLCKAAADAGVPVGLYGGTPGSLADFAEILQRLFPTLQIGCAIAPPFRPLTPEEDAAYTQQIIESGVRILLVGIGCPKQERWMAAHKGRIPAVMVGVGAAFDFHAGRVRQAPRWMQRAGLEWAFRLAMEPRRLWKRYAKHNPRFLLFFGAQLLRTRLAPSASRQT